MKKPVKNFREWSRSSFNLNESVQFPTNHDEIEQILRYYEIENYSIRPDGTVDVNGDVDLRKQDFEYFPVKFGIVKGGFDCNRCKNLKSLKGAPKECENFYCHDCINLKSLEGAPKECEYFNCRYCEKKLESLEGAPKECKYFNCSWCKNLKSLEGAPEECEEFTCHDCINLKSLEGAPKKCKRFNCSWCEKLESLEGAPKECENFFCHDCINLKSLEGAPKECEEFNCSDCKNLEYSLEHFPKCKKINIYDIYKTCFEKLYNALGEDNFIRLINKNSNVERETFLAINLPKDLDFNKLIKPLLKDKTMTEETFKHTYRGAVAGERFRF